MTQTEKEKEVGTVSFKILSTVRTLTPWLKVFFNVPNSITHLRILSVWPLKYLIESGHPLAIWVYLAALATDLIDGKAALILNRKTEFGKIWDPLADKVLHLTILYVFSRRIEDPTLPFFTVLLLSLFLAVLPGLAMFVHIFLGKPLRPLGSNPAGKLKFTAEGIAIALLLLGQPYAAKDVLWFAAIPLASVSIMLHIFLRREVSILILVREWQRKRRERAES